MPMGGPWAKESALMHTNTVPGHPNPSVRGFALTVAEARPEVTEVCINALSSACELVGTCVEQLQWVGRSGTGQKTS